MRLDQRECVVQFVGNAVGEKPPLRRLAYISTLKAVKADLDETASASAVRVNVPAIVGSSDRRACRSHADARRISAAR